MERADGTLATEGTDEALVREKHGMGAWGVTGTEGQLSATKSCVADVGCRAELCGQPTSASSTRSEECMRRAFEDEFAPFAWGADLGLVEHRTARSDDAIHYDGLDSTRRAGSKRGSRYRGQRRG